MNIHDERELEDGTEQGKSKARARRCGNLEPELGKSTSREGPHLYKEKWFPILRQEYQSESIVSQS